MISNKFRSGRDKYVLGAHVISKMIPVQHPMIMVDNITSFNYTLNELTAERYVSANEAVFKCHYPELKLWPGVYTIEGLRQCCLLFEALQNVEKAGLSENLMALQNLLTMNPQVNRKMCKDIQVFLKKNRMKDWGNLKVKIKLLNPVFAGSIINYRVYKVKGDDNKWLVSANSNRKKVAEGEIGN